MKAFFIVRLPFRSFDIIKRTILSFHHVKEMSVMCKHDSSVYMYPQAKDKNKRIK